MSAKRYYAEYVRNSKLCPQAFAGGWELFDRGHEGCEPYIIAFCVSRAVAFKIRDALNAQEESLDSGAAIVLDWFTLAPKYRTKAKLRKMLEERNS